MSLTDGVNSHGWHAGHLQEPQYSADFGDYLSFVSHLKNNAREKGVDLIVLDTGDRAEGENQSRAPRNITKADDRKWAMGCYRSHGEIHPEPLPRTSFGYPHSGKS